MESDMPQHTQGTSTRGFASMDETRQREIARKGGESVPAEKRSFSQNRALAAEAGRKGGTSRGTRITTDEKTGTTNARPPQASTERLAGYRAKNSPSQAKEENNEEFEEAEDTDEEDADEEDDSSQYHN